MILALHAVTVAAVGMSQQAMSMAAYIAQGPQLTVEIADLNRVPPEIEGDKVAGKRQFASRGDGMPAHIQHPLAFMPVELGRIIRRWRKQMRQAIGVYEHRSCQPDDTVILGLQQNVAIITEQREVETGLHIVPAAELRPQMAGFSRLRTST